MAFCDFCCKLYKVKKESIRKKIKELKKQSPEILADKSLSKKTRLFIKALLVIVDVVVIALLEKKTRKTSENSGIPPSSDPSKKGNRNKKGENSGKKSPSSQLDNSKVEKKEETLSPKTCSNCNADLEDGKVVDTEQRKEIDIEYVVVETTVTAETKECPECQEKTKASFPEGMDGPIQYGDGIKALIINLLMGQMLPIQRTQEYLMGLIGRMLSPATILKFITQFGKSLKKWEEDVTMKLLVAPALYVDETSMRVKKKLYWIHTYSYKDIVLQYIHPKRGLEAMGDIGILPKYGGIAVHDCWASYFSFEGMGHALCNAHLIRELKFVEDSIGYLWATKLKRLLKVAITMVNSREGKILTQDEYTKLVRLYEDILIQGLAELPLFPESSTGRVKLTDAQNLWIRLYDHKDAVLLFAKVAEVDPTNNNAERSLRMNKVKQKISGCFRSFEIAQHFCRIYSYLKTMRSKGYSTFQAIDLALKGQIPPM